MAIEVIQRIIDDIDHSPIPEGEAHEVYFSVGRKNYQIHLSDANLEKFNEQIGFYVERARELKAPKKSGKKGTTVTANVPLQEELPMPDAGGKKKHLRPGIRAWAIEHGYTISPKGGRIPLEVEQAYDEAHQ